MAPLSCPTCPFCLVMSCYGPLRKQEQAALSLLCAAIVLSLTWILAVALLALCVSRGRTRGAVRGVMAEVRGLRLRWSKNPLAT